MPKLENDSKVQDIVEIDMSQDGDVCNQEELNRLYQQPYFCSARKAVGLEKLYILHIDCEWNSKKLAAALSNHSIHLTSTDTLDKISTFIAHDQTIVDVHFNPITPDCVLTGSSDGSIRVWDIRNPQKWSQEFRDDTDQKRKPFLSFDINCDGTLLCGGTEKVKSDTYLFVWDTRSPKVLAAYSEFHENDISHVQFHPTSPNTLASCSIDCLVNIYDLNEKDEDDAFQFCLNTETTCGRLQWLGYDTKAKQESIAVTTSTEDVQIWDVEEAAPKHVFTREKIADALRRKKPETCFAIRCFQTGEGQHPLLLAGSNTPNRGCLRMLKMSQDVLEPYAILFDEKGGNSQTIRGAAFNPASGQVVSGGEDGIINVWMPGEDKPLAVNNTRKVKSKFTFERFDGAYGRIKPYSK
ncbi:hypothetical protein GHT06_021847 [Daphnia sinensis]|uniref:WD repeat-containing protein 89 n=1 Tax=Daphnia sinensis TaxID=1820382 RepID=A0AAD5KGQ6_9CRUS|nr:hypothetical protein GHT06_021847 [Daphnia sinensis]